MRGGKEISSFQRSFYKKNMKIVGVHETAPPSSFFKTRKSHARKGEGAPRPFLPLEKHTTPKAEMEMDRDPSATWASPMDPRWAPEATHARHIPASVRSRQIKARKLNDLDKRMEPGDFRALPSSHHPVDPFATDGTLGPTRRTGGGGGGGGGSGGEGDPFQGGNWSLVEGLLAGRLDPRPPSPLKPGTEGGPPAGARPSVVHSFVDSLSTLYEASTEMYTRAPYTVPDVDGERRL